MSNFKLPKWAVMVLAAFVFIPLVADWAAPGAGTRIAYEALREAEGGGGRRMLFPLWSWLVGLVGKDVVALGWLSACAGMVCVWFVAAIAGAIFGAAVCKAKQGGVKGANEFPFAEGAAVLVAGLAFALTPGFLAAATRMGPLTVALVPGLAAVALAVRPRKGRLLLAIGLVGYSAYELVLARRAFCAMAFPAVWVWLAVGVMPALVIAWCVRRRKLVSKRSQLAAFGGWAFAVLVMGGVTFTSGRLDEGRVASWIVAQIVANAEGRERGTGDGGSGKIALVGDGTLDDLLFFTLPEKVKLISLAREREPEYGRELSEWVRGRCNVGIWKYGNEKMGEMGKCENGASTTNYQLPTTNLVEDLAFAAELGPRVLVDEWVKLDKAGFEAKVANVANYFPTREAWDEACGALTALRPGEPLADYLRHFVAVCGNALACRKLESGKVERLKGDCAREAWDIFRTIVEKVEPKNYAALLNMQGMVDGGYAVPKDEVALLAKRRQAIEKDLKGWEQILGAARSGGRIYADPEKLAEYEAAKRKAAAKRELSPEQKAFVETVAAAPKNKKSGRAAQESIHRAIREGKVRADRIGGRLIAIDVALGDFDSAEKDAIAVLKLDRHDPTANATLGALAGSRGDYERAERYLRRAIATGKASVAAKNDLAYVYCRQGRLDEAEAFAREAVKAHGEHWTLRETLAAILIRKGRIDEGERELNQAEELAEKAGLVKGKVASIAIDRARLLKAKGDARHFKVAMRQLNARKDLSEEQLEEVKNMGW